MDSRNTSPFPNATPLPNTPQYNTYVGARYIPIFDGAWDSTKKYEPLVVVEHQGNSYTSKTYVPVGVDINNENYWAVSGNYNAQVGEYHNEVIEYMKKVTELNKEVDDNTVAIEDLRKNSGKVFISVKSYGAKGDGSTDDTNAILNTINIARSSGYGVFFPMGVYIISAMLPLHDYCYFKGSGHSSTIRMTRGVSEPIFGTTPNTDTHNVTAGIIIEDLNLDKNETTSSTGLSHCIRLVGARDGVIRGCKIHHAKGYGIGMQGRSDHKNIYDRVPVSNFKVENCEIYLNGLNNDGNDNDGLDIKWGSNIVITGCYFHENSDAGLDIRGNHILVSNCIFINNKEGMRIRNVAANEFFCRVNATNCVFQQHEGHSIPITFEDNTAGIASIALNNINIDDRSENAGIVFITAKNYNTTILMSNIYIRSGAAIEFRSGARTRLNAANLILIKAGSSEKPIIENNGESPIKIGNAFINTGGVAYRGTNRGSVLYNCEIVGDVEDEPTILYPL